MKLPEIEIPAWVAGVPRVELVTAGGAAAALLLVVVYARVIRRRSKALNLPAVRSDGGGGVVRQTVATAGPLAILGACGMVLSLYGLYGFATTDMKLPVLFAIPMMAIFDVAEVTSFVSLYRSAATETTWTRPMRRTRRMAWMLVCASSAMNAAHAPGNWIATVAFATVPVVSAKLIEFELEKLLAANSDAEDEDFRPGFVRLVQLGYVHAWAAIFARLGLDAASRDGIIHQDARIRRAARQLHYLGRALDAQEKAPKDAKRRTGKRVEAKHSKTVDRLQVKAGMAIDVAGIAGDTPAQLTLARHLVTRGRLRDLARMDVRDPLGIVRMLEELAIVPSAEAISAGARAAQAEEQRERAEAARDKAQEEQTEAEARALKIEAQAEAELERARGTLAKAEKHAAAALRKAEESAKAAADAETQRGTAQDEHDRLSTEIEELAERARNLKVSANSSSTERKTAAEELDTLLRQAGDAERLLKQRKQVAEEEARKAQKARADHQETIAKAEEVGKQVQAMTRQVEQLQADAQRYTQQRQREVGALEDFAKQKAEADETARRARQLAEEARTEAREAEAEKNAAHVALRHSRTEIMDALTSPDPYEPPRWTSPAKVRGWELYLHKVRTERTEPTDADLAGADRDPSTARKWLPEFRAELARMTASALPAQHSAHDRSADETPALV